MPSVSKQGDGVRRDTIENLNSYQSNTKSSRNRERHTEIFWSENVNVPVVIIMTVPTRFAMIVFHREDIAVGSGVTLSLPD